MKIGLVRRGYSETGGAERYLLRFADGLESQGHTCVLFSDRAWPESAWGNREQVILDKARSPVAFADALMAASPKPSVCDFLFSLERVHDCDCYRAGDGVHAAWLERRARFESRWRSTFRKRNPKHRQILELENSLFRPESSTHVIANAQFVKEEIVQHYGTPTNRITVIPNGFDPAPISEETDPSLRRELGLSSDHVSFLFVGSGWERKGLPFAIKAIESLVDRGKPAVLLVAGKDKHSPRVQRPESVRFLGPLPSERLSALYEAADVFLLPTLYDPFSNATLEAASHGLPVITTTANGIADLFPDLQGTLVEDPSTPELTAACEKWLDTDLRSSARKTNREIAAGYSVARNVDATLACFEQLLPPTGS